MRKALFTRRAFLFLLQDSFLEKKTTPKEQLNLKNTDLFSLRNRTKL